MSPLLAPDQQAEERGEGTKGEWKIAVKSRAKRLIYRGILVLMQTLQSTWKSILICSSFWIKNTSYYIYINFQNCIWCNSILAPVFSNASASLKQLFDINRLDLHQFRSEYIGTSRTTALTAASSQPSTPPGRHPWPPPRPPRAKKVSKDQARTHNRDFQTMALSNCIRRIEPRT